MIRFNQVSDGSIQGLSFVFGQGATAKVLFGSDDQKNELYAVLIGLHRPGAGHVFLFDEDLYALKERERLSLFRRVGVVPGDGGMISNLKAWENLLLPAWYHRGITARQAEQDVVAIFRQLGLDEADLKKRMGRLPDQLTLYEKRAVALVRAMLMEPDILIYDFIFTGLDRDEVQRLMKITEDYHGRKDGRISLFLCPEDAISAQLPADHTINLAH